MLEIFYFMLGKRVFHFAKGILHTPKFLNFLGHLTKMFVKVLFFSDFGIVRFLKENKLCLQVRLMLIIDNRPEMRLIRFPVMWLYVCTDIHVTVSLCKSFFDLFNPTLFLAVFFCWFEQLKVRFGYSMNLEQIYTFSQTLENYE